jgi:phage terminase large subunit-like protein
MKYRQPGMLMLWSHEPLAPWQTPQWLEQMRDQLRPIAYQRIIENHFVHNESEFIEMAKFDACVDPSLRPMIYDDPRLDLYGGVDASTKKDSTAIALCRWDSKTRRVVLVWHKIFQPSKENPLDFEATIEETLLQLKRRFRLREIRYDPYQMVNSAQRMLKRGVPMVEFPQTVPNLLEASQNFYDLIKGNSLLVYPDADIRLAVSRAVAFETARGWRISKEKASHKIDIVVALAQACLGAVRSQGTRWIGAWGSGSLPRTDGGESWASIQRGREELQNLIDQQQRRR